MDFKLPGFFYFGSVWVESIKIISRHSHKMLTYQPSMDKNLADIR